MREPSGGRPEYAVLAALPEELAPLFEFPRASQTVQGLEILRIELPRGPLLACVGGVGKVNAAHATAALLERGGARGLLVVGVCGGLRSHLAPGTLVHCERAVQADLALTREREVEADAALRAAWETIAPGGRGWFLTADRPVLSWWRRLRLARAFRGDCVADMETAAAARVARKAGVPWAALRAVTDGATEIGLAEFRRNFALQAGRAAASVPALLEALAERR